MNRLLTHLSIFVLICLTLSACSKEDETSYCWVLIGNGKFVWTEVDQMPHLANGTEESFNAALLAEINYPAEAREAGIEGEVTLSYEITTGGIVENIVITEDIGGGCGEAARSAFETVTATFIYQPAIMDGVPVHVRKEIPFRFELQ
jgi:TonB family protein